MVAKILQQRNPVVYPVLWMKAWGGPLILGLSYGVVEYFLISSSPFSPIFTSQPTGYLYRVAYGLVLFLPFAARNYWIWFARGALAMTVEDASYWAFYYWRTGGFPLQWAWYYPVWNNIPLLYLTLPLIAYSFWRGTRRQGLQLTKRNNPPTSQGPTERSGISVTQSS